MEHSPSSQADYTEQQKQAIITSMCGPLMNRVKLIIQNPLKNKQLAQNNHLNSLVELVAEHLLPQYCVNNYQNSQKLSTMHSLCFLLASKVQSVFTAGVIRTCIDQNWDLKGYKSVLLRILSELGQPLEDQKKLQEFFDKMIQSQNLQSQSCIKAISQFLRNKNRSQIDEDDLKNPIVSFQTSFQFVRDEIEKFRSQNMNHTCFTVLHPWAYDLDLVDFKYVINRDQTEKISQAFQFSFEAQVFWLTYFKSQISASADEFFGALKEMSIMNHVQDFFEAKLQSYKIFMLHTNFVVSLAENSEDIQRFILEIVSQAQKSQNFNVLRDQLRIRQEPRLKTEYIEENKFLISYKISQDPDFAVLNSILKGSKLVQLKQDQVKKNLDIKRHVFEIKPASKQVDNLYLKFTNVDTEELKDLEIKFDGNMAQFKVGEGDCNHYVISNDKKLWESQFMILCKDGRYYIRDLGIVHTSRIKVNAQTQLQIHQGALLDLGKVVHYHVDKLIHEKVPSNQSNPNFIVMKGSQANYRVDEEAILRARPTWISADENKDLVQNEIILENSDKSAFSVGRSNRRDVEIKLKAVSADHCKIEYQRDIGWFIHEKEKDRLSSNGTFVFMKSLQQMDDHEPSDIIPLFNGMTVSFINYELQVRIEAKSSDELASSQFEEIKLSEAPKVQSSPSQDAHISQTHQELQHQYVQKEEATPVKTSQQKPQEPKIYDEDLQATHNQKSHPQLVEDHHQSPNQHHDDHKHEELKEQSVAHSHHSSYQDFPIKDDQFERQSSHNDQHDDMQDEVNKSVHKDASQKSLRQSVQSIHSSTSKQQLDQDNHSDDNEVKAQTDAKDDEEDRKSVISQPKSHRSSNSQAYKQDEDKNQNHQIIDDVKSQHEESPKPKSQASKKNFNDEDEQKHEIQRSYSQHHIGEILDKAKAQDQVHNQSQSLLIHSDDEEELKKDEVVEQAHNKSVHDSHIEDDVKSHLSKKSLKSESVIQDETVQQTHHDEKKSHDQENANQDHAHNDHHEIEHKHQPKEVKAHLEESPKSQKSIHNQSVHDISQKSLHHDQDNSHVQEQHHETHPQVHEETKHNESIHEEEFHNQSVHEEQKHDKSVHEEHQNEQSSHQDKKLDKSIHEEEKHSKSVNEEEKHNQSVHSVHHDKDEHKDNQHEVHTAHKDGGHEQASAIQHQDSHASYHHQLTDHQVTDVNQNQSHDTQIDHQGTQQDQNHSINNDTNDQL